MTFVEKKITKIEAILIFIFAANLHNRLTRCLFKILRWRQTQIEIFSVLMYLIKVEKKIRNMNSINIICLKISSSLYENYRQICIFTTSLA
jgi:hypothetical protein